MPKQHGVDELAAAITWSEGIERYRSFWETRVIGEIRATKRRVDQFRSYGQAFRLVALAASATVTALAGFDGQGVKLATALAGIVAVVSTGASAVFRVDQRVVANRKAESDLIGAGWRFVTAVPGPDPVTFPAFVEKIEDLLEVYRADYSREIDRTPA